jgi:parallel beta-helix repeat protein
VHISTAEFVECNFQNNHSSNPDDEPANGAEIRSDGTEVSFTSCRFTGNDQGATSIDLARPTFNECIFEENNVGAYIPGGYITLVSCIMRQSVDVGLWAGSEASGTAQECEIVGSRKVGVLIEDQGTEFTFTKCQVTNTVEFTGVVVKEAGSAVLDNCLLTGNKMMNLEVASGGRAVVRGSRIFATRGGVGVKAVSGSIEITGSELGQEALSAILLEGDASCKVTNCDISRCGTCGICARGTSHGDFAQNRVHDMTMVGIQIEGGSLSLCENEISNCQTHGIYIKSGATPQVINNQFQGIALNDVERG